jgi:hypothetical protein
MCRRSCKRGAAAALLLERDPRGLELPPKSITID